MITIFASIMLAASAADGPATPISRIAPPFPASCTIAADAPDGRVQVIVAYSVTAEGGVETPRVRESSDHCFDDASIAAVRSWRFQPARRDGRNVRQDEIETTIIYKLGDETTTEDFDARPFVRVPPKYPEICMRSAKRRETVYVEFDVTAEGSTTNVRVIDTTNKCLDKSALDSVERWKYRPKTVNGVAVERKGVQTAITYELSWSTFEAPMRRAFVKKMNKVHTRLKKGDDPEMLIQSLDEIEAEFGDDFSFQERGAFYQFRGAVKLEKKDYRGALDDFRAALRGGLSDEAIESTSRVVRQLEDYIEAEDARASAENAGEVSESAATPAPSPGEVTEE